MFQQLEQVDAMQRAALNNVFALQQSEIIAEERQRAQQQNQLDQEVNGLLRHVGCQRYREAMREYMQVRISCCVASCRQCNEHPFGK